MHACCKFRAFAKPSCFARFREFAKCVQENMQFTNKIAKTRKKRENAQFRLVSLPYSKKGRQPFNQDTGNYGLVLVFSRMFDN